MDGAILLVDASEGPLPQTRFVLKKALEAGLRIIVVINKIDRQDARPDEVLDEIYDLFIDLDATEDQLDFPLLYAIGRDGIAQARIRTKKATDLHVLYRHDPRRDPRPDPRPGRALPDARIGPGLFGLRGPAGRRKDLQRQRPEARDSLVCIGENGEAVPLKVTKLQVYEGMNLKDVDEVRSRRHRRCWPASKRSRSAIPSATAGSPGPAAHHAWTSPPCPWILRINNSPFGGKEGKYVQSQPDPRASSKETLLQRGHPGGGTGDRDMIVVKGRGEFQLAILIETMRREGYRVLRGPARGHLPG